MYTDYLSRRYSVNRRYQRKLVWTVEEKRALVDSILKDLPIPLVLVAEISSPMLNGYELIDGMQRLNAIFSFIENEFDLDGYYFDLEALADTKDRRDRGEITQLTPVLSRDQTRKIANYLLPISIFKAPSTDQVDEVFRRINAGGRTLSGQELRQAGSTTEIAQLVRVVSSRIRGDSSRSDIVSLEEMSRLSINNKQLDYGVDVDSIFWVQQSILRRLDVRSSVDEQLILDILVDCLVDPIQSSGTDTRDAVYGKHDRDKTTAAALEKRVEGLIEAYGLQQVEDDFFLVFDELRAVLKSSKERFVKLVVGRTSGGRYPRYFQAVYLAFWHLIIRDGMRVADREKAVALLKDIGTPKGPLNIPGGGGDWTADDKRKNIRAVKGAVQEAFEKADDNRKDASRFGLASLLEKVLANSVTEQSLCELKQGLLSLNGNSRAFDQKSWDKILKTITAIANDGPESTGYLVIGVADKAADVTRIQALDGVEASHYRGFDIVGIEREAVARGESTKTYFDWIMDKLSGSALPDSLRSQVSAGVSLIDYYGRAVVLVKINCADGPFFYKDEVYERKGSGTSLVPQSDWKRLYKKF
ncbi:DUF262 domain-containing protein [Umezawaea sp. NPDC059074]|uniref:GmrSD restriction endonuclease domain-containing protein n=1 Tax=Umezawaea sp. NPDC059074 TaxID=3346716 RepID=UPI0036AB4E57